MSANNFKPNSLQFEYKDKKNESKPKHYREAFIDLFNFLENINKVYPEDEVYSLLKEIKKNHFSNGKVSEFFYFSEDLYFKQNITNSNFYKTNNQTIGLNLTFNADKLIQLYYLLIERISNKIIGFECIFEVGTKRNTLKKRAAEISKNNCFFPPQSLRIRYKDNEKFYNPYNYSEIVQCFSDFFSLQEELFPLLKNIANNENLVSPEEKKFILFNEEFEEENTKKHHVSQNKKLAFYPHGCIRVLVGRIHTFIDALKQELKDDFDISLLVGTQMELGEENYHEIQNQEKIEEELNIKDNLSILNEKNNKPNKSFLQNTILLSNPNSGKTYSVKKLIGKNKFWELSFQNNDNVLEWKKNILFKNINGNIVIGNIIKAITSATLNPNADYFIFADEIGTFSLDNILGNVLKNIFKKSQKIEIKPEMIRDLKDKEFITLDEFLELGERISHKFQYRTTTFVEEELNIPLWIPNNLHFVFCANYENELLDSLSNLKGWGDSGDRFTVKHFYNLKGRDFFKHKYDESKQLFETNKYNKIIQATYESLLKNSDLSTDTIKTLKSHFNKYKILLSNYDNSIMKNDNKSEYVLKHIEEYIYSLFLDEEDEDIIIEAFKDAL